MKTREEIVEKANAVSKRIKDEVNLVTLAKLIGYLSALLWVLNMHETDICKTCLRVDCKCSPD